MTQGFVQDHFRSIISGQNDRMAIVNDVDFGPHDDAGVGEFAKTIALDLENLVNLRYGAFDFLFFWEINGTSNFRQRWSIDTELF